MVRLFHFPLSPFCRKVRLTLAEKRIEVELVEEHYWEKAPELMRRNPAGRVPVLQIDGLTLSDSQAICEYLDETRPEARLMPEDPVERAEVRRLCAWFDDHFHAEVGRPLLRERALKKVTKSGAPPDSTAVREALRAMGQHLDYMGQSARPEEKVEGGLLERRRWLAGDAMSLADFTAAAHLSCLDYVSDVDWNRCEPVREWYSKIKSRPAFRTLLADQVPGFRPSRHYADLDF